MPHKTSFTPAAESHGLWPWMNAPTFGRDVAPQGRWSGAIPILIGVGLHKTSSDLLVHSETYVCLFFRQNGGDSLLQEEENPNPQLFHIGLWI